MMKNQLKIFIEGNKSYKQIQKSATNKSTPRKITAIYFKQKLTEKHKVQSLKLTLFSHTRIYTLILSASQ